MAKEAKVSMIDLIRQKVEQSSGTGLIFLKVKDKEKRKVRILTELDDVVVVSFHDSYKYGVNQPCYKYFGRSKCPLCTKTKDDGFRTRDIFIFSVYDYESKEVKLMMEAANDCSPLPAMLDFYETHGTMCDRDYTISRRGKSFDTSYTLIPGDKSKFRGKNIEALDEEEVFEKLKERHLTKMKDVLKKIKDGTLEIEVNKDDEEEEEVKPKAKKKNDEKLKVKSKAKKKEAIDDDDYFEEEDDEIPFDTDEEDEDDDDDEYEEEEVKPKRKPKPKRR